MRFVATAAGMPAARGLLAGVSLAALALAGTPALAEESAEQASATAPADTAAADESRADDGAAGQPNPDDGITVTGSRIRANGMTAPVPVTVVNAEEIETLSPGALITGVSQLPQFYGNQTPNSGNFFVRSGYGSLNLRGLGVNRTLTLLNGRRVPSTSAFGGVDINLFPEAMIRSVETTTGGASAAYGTDAVAGVVNFILDTDFTGVEFHAEGGVTDRNDGTNYKLSLAYGTDFAGGRGHLLASGEYYDQEGIFDYRGRGWYGAWGTFGSGTPADPYYFAPDVRSANASFDGTIFAPGTAINGLQFDSSGNLHPFQPGSILQGAVGTPPARTNGGTADDLGGEVASLYPDLDRYSLFAYADYELTDGFKVFAQFLHGRTHIFQYNTPRGSFGGTPTALTIFQDNAFLPDGLRQTMVANNIPSFTLRRMGSFLDVGQLYIDDTTTQYIGTGGFTWNIAGGLLENWQIEGYYQYGESTRDWRQFGLRVDRVFAAVDAVRDPSGTVVCRVSLFGDSFPGCQPLNLFGRGNASQAAVDYVTGFEPGQRISTPLYFADSGFSLGQTYDYTTSPEKVGLTTFKQHFAELSASGNLFDGWAGPIAAAFGGSYRKDSIRQVVQDVTNPASDHASGHPVLCNGEVPGLRGVSQADCLNTVGVQYSKVSNILGSADVWEAFGEVLVPLVDAPGFKARVNGALRWANYQGSGTIWAYKGGAEADIGGMVRLRGTYSRDVRAANLSERFDKTGGVATIDDPRTPSLVEAINVTRFSGGNPNVNPEKADTYTAGIVFTPSFLPGLSASVDWYDIKMKGAIGQVGTQNVVNRCFLDNEQQFCDLITLDGSGNIILVGDVYVNIARSEVSGVDAEIDYNTPVTLFGGGEESLSARAFASWLIERSDGDTDYAGQTGASQSSGVYLPYPDFKATGSITYRHGGFSFLTQARYIGPGIQDACAAGRCPNQTVYLKDNRVDSALYIDLRLAYDFKLNGSDTQVFASVTNLFDQDPPITPSYSAFLGYSTQYNTAVYDVLGRRYTIGVKVKM
jgi:outer membrane receptor protein involved in Fe transport